MSFSTVDKTQILSLKSKIASYYSLQMKKIGDRKLDSLFFDNCIITGGCISSLYHDTAVKDIDLYAKTTKSMQEIKKYITESGPKDNIKLFSEYVLDDNNPKPPEHCITENAVTLTNDVQFIYLGDASTCRKKFDFIHCMPWFDIKTQKFYISEAQFESIRKKELVKNPSYIGEIKEPRYNKYLNRGWKWARSQTILNELDTNLNTISAIA